jgi:type IV pilus assembly protein PilY1
MNPTSRQTNLPGKAQMGRVPAIVAGFFATLLSLPAGAANPIDFPNVPLQSNTTVPPNIMLILDDSGSMANDYMPAPGAASDSAPATTTAGGKPNIGPLTYVLNGIYYNPSTDYDPWTKADGTKLADPGPTAAFDSDTLASGTPTINLTNDVQSFFIPKTGTTGAALLDAVNYERYQILAGAGAGAMYKSVLTVVPVVPATTGTLDTNASATNGNYTTNQPVVVPAFATQLRITTNAGTGTRGDLYVRQAGQPDIGTYDCRGNANNTNVETCTIANPVAGVWNVRMYANGGDIGGVTVSYSVKYDTRDALNCDIATASGWGWTGCVSAPSFARATVSSERDNFATWYSFYRTRNKTAKAGASQAFSDIGVNLRVGFSTIWRRNTFRIPVGSDGGLFRDTVSPASTNRTTWFNRLFAATASNGTPLQGALQTAGEYFKETGFDGPYGPEATGQIACRQNFAILTTDGFWNDQSFFDSAATGNSDATSTGIVPVPPGNSTTVPYAYTAARPYSDGSSGTLADVAMRYWKGDLRADLLNKVPVSADDPAYWQHMTTFGISIGLQGTLNPKTDLDKIGPNNDLTDGGIVWPDPVPNPESNKRIDDLWHASVNGHGDFVVATSAKEFADGLKAALAAIDRKTASGSSVATSGPRVTGNNRAFSASYVSGAWSGELAAYNVTPTGIDDIPLWKASAKIPAVASRNLFTFNGTAGIPFAWASLTASQKAALGSQAIFDYITGVRTGEGSKTAPTYRVRDGVLGDIVNSSPEYLTEAATILPPTLPAVDSVFVGSNDGMLHAFNATTGVEQFAYVPGGISFGDLKSYSTPAYAHYFFVDGPLVSSLRSQTPGKNVLVGALGRGGHGLYALNVANPTAFTTSDVLWEQNASADMGNIIGKPIIAKLNNGVMAVIVANGINSTNNQAALFVYNLLTGVEISKLVTTVSPVASGTNPNGLSSLRGWDSDSDGDIDLVYGGDLLGNVWKFDISSATTSTWAAPTVPLFSAKDSGGKAQAITGGFTIALDPITFDNWVFFGTGRFLVGDDLSNKDVQTWYGIKDIGPITSRSQLVQRQITYYQPAVEDNPLTTPDDETKAAVRAFGNAVVGDLTGKRGWYLDLVNPPYGAADKIGERMVFDPLLIGGTVLVEASQSPSKDPCDVGGTGFINAIDAFTGGSLGSPFFDANGDGFVNDNDKVDNNGNPVVVGSIDPNVGMPSTPTVVGSVLILGGSGGGKPARIVIPPSGSSGRISWREILRD